MSFPTLNIGDLIAKTPIVQGGMGVGISLSRLASAVANEGGIGVIAGAMIGMKEPDVASNPIEANLRALRREIEKAREATQGIIGVNIMVALTTFAEMVRTSIEAKADVIFSGAGLPMDLPKIFNETCERKKEEFKTKLVPIISSGRALVNNFIDSMRDGGKKPFKCIFHCVKTCEQEKTPYCIAAALINAMKGNLERGFAFCGENVSRVNNIVSVHDLISSLQREFDAIINKPAAATVKA